MWSVSKLPNAGIFINETTLTLSISFGGNNWKIIIFLAFSFFVSCNFMTADQHKTLISVSIHHQIFVQKVRVQSIIIEKFLKFLDHDFSIKIFSQLKLMMHIIKNIQVYERFEFTYTSNIIIFQLFSQHICSQSCLLWFIDDRPVSKQTYNFETDHVLTITERRKSYNIMIFPRDSFTFGTSFWKLKIVHYQFSIFRKGDSETMLSPHFGNLGPS